MVVQVNGEKFEPPREAPVFRPTAEEFKVGVSIYKALNFFEQRLPYIYFVYVSY